MKNRYKKDILIFLGSFLWFNISAILLFHNVSFLNIGPMPWQELWDNEWLFAVFSCVGSIGMVLSFDEEIFKS